MSRASGAFVRAEISRNAPYILGFRACLFALAGGNTAVLKGSELSPRCYWAIGKVFHDAGLPSGCLNVLLCRPEDAPSITKSIIEDPIVKKVNFTGSTNVGSIISEICGKNLKPCLMELGGKNSAIVLEDADLEVAARECALGSFFHVSLHTRPVLDSRLCDMPEMPLAASANAPPFTRVAKYVCPPTASLSIVPSPLLSKRNCPLQSLKSSPLPPAGRFLLLLTASKSQRA